MKKIFSKRWFGNLLIILFGIIILFIIALLSYHLFFTSADVNNALIGDGSDPQLNFVYSPETISPPERGYRVANISGASVPFLEIFNQDQISAVMGSEARNHPTYVVGYGVVLSADEPLQYRPMAIVPLPPYNYAYKKLASEGTAAYKFLNWAKARSLQTNLADERSALSNAVDEYNKAILIGSSTYLIDYVGKVVLSKDPAVLDDCPGAPADCDPDVLPGIIDGGSEQDPYDAFKVSIDPNIHYSRPSNNSLALKVLFSASAEARRVGDTTGKAKIDAAISNYIRQIQNSATSDGLSISSVNTIRHGESQNVGFSVNLQGLNIGNSVALSRVIFNIDQNTFCNVEFSGTSNHLTSDSQNCTWDTAALSGTFAWTPGIGQEVGTANPGTRILALKAFSTATSNNEFGQVTKNVTVLPGTGDETTNGGGSVPMRVVAPQSVDKSNENAAKRVQIKISASNLNPNGIDGPNRVGKISWYICTGSQQTIQNNDSTGCFEKEKFGPFAQNSFDNKIVEWDASGSAAGTYVVMLKAFSMPTAPDTYPPYPGATKVVSSNITVVENMTGDGGTGGGGDGETGGSIIPDWAANLQQSSITTISALIRRIGSFTILILAILAVIAIIIAGMKYITAGGEQKGAESGKKAILYTVYGIAIAVLSIQLVQITISEVRKMIGQSLPAPGETNNIILPGFGGANASVYSIFSHNSGLIWRIIQLAVYYAEAVAFFYVLYASFLYITSFGDESKAESGKKTLVWSIIGLAIVISANILLNTFAEIIAP